MASLMGMPAWRGGVEPECLRTDAVDQALWACLAAHLRGNEAEILAAHGRLNQQLEGRQLGGNLGDLRGHRVSVPGSLSARAPIWQVSMWRNGGDEAVCMVPMLMGSVCNSCCEVPNSRHRDYGKGLGLRRWDEGHARVKVRFRLTMACMATSLTVGG